MFKILQQMMADLAKFLCIWAILLVMFVCVGMLAFGQLEGFKEMLDILIFFIESALGEWDMVVYEGTNHKGENLETIQKLGTYFQVVFLLINTVLMLNFVIAILSSTFKNYEGIKIGLYYNVLIEVFAKMGWDDTYGCLVCA
jgi:hypothetical protein